MRGVEWFITDKNRDRFWMPVLHCDGCDISVLESKVRYLFVCLLFCGFAVHIDLSQINEIMGGGGSESAVLLTRPSRTVSSLFRCESVGKQSF